MPKKCLFVEKDALTCDMETFQLLHLAQSSKGTISASAAKIILANRVTAGVLDSQTMAKVKKRRCCYPRKLSQHALSTPFFVF